MAKGKLMENEGDVTVEAPTPYSTGESITVQSCPSTSAAADVASKIGMVAMPCFFLIIWLAVMVFMFIMMWKMVRAFEKIAAVFEKGIVVKKQDSSSE